MNKLEHISDIILWIFIFWPLCIYHHHKLAI